MKRLWWLLIPATVVFIIGMLIWMPVPSFLTDQIPALIEGQLPQGWKVSHWRFNRFSLVNIRQGKLPAIQFEIGNGRFHIPIELNASWNNSYENPEIRIDFTTKITSPDFSTSKISGRGYVQATKNFANFISWNIEILPKEKIEIKPYGWIDGLSLLAVTPIGDEMNGNLQIAEAQMQTSLSENDLTVKIKELNSGFVFAPDKEHFLEILKTISLKIEDLSIHHAYGETKISEFSYYSQPIDNAKQSPLMKEVEVLAKNISAKIKSVEDPWLAEAQKLKITGTAGLHDQQWNTSGLNLTLPGLSFKQGTGKDISFENMALSVAGSMAKAKAELRVPGGALLWNELLMILPEKGIQFYANKSADDFNLKVAGLLQKKFNLSGSCKDRCHLTWHLSSDIAKDMTTYQQMNPEFTGFPFSAGGGWNTTGQIKLTNGFQPIWSTFKNTLDLQKLYLRYKEAVAIDNLSLNWPMIGRGNVKARFAIKNLQYKNFKGSLKIDPWQWSYNLAKGHFGFSFVKVQTGGDLAPLQITNQTLDYKTAKEFSFQGSLVSKIKDLSPYLTKMCLGKKETLPKVTLNIQYPQIIMDQDKLLPKGFFDIELFDGKAELKNFKVFKWNTSVPETQFDFNMQGLQLAALGKFLNFGNMEGTLMAYARDVVMQSRLPTRFLSKISLLPLTNKKEVIFSSKAMQNFTQLFTPQDFTQQIPGFLRWFTFGWPSDAIGGFNIQYAGISMYSKEGSILLETLDPPDVVAKEKGHFLLYGYRFKIPINYWSYPVVLDHQGMSQFISHMYSYLLNLKAQNSTESDGDKNDQENWCQYKISSPQSY